MEKNRICGIYIFESQIERKGSRNKIGHKYVGQSINILGRKSDHLTKLRNKRHENLKLQHYFNKYGENSLKFYILHECLESELNFYEMFWIKCFDSFKNGFNLNWGGHDATSNKKRCVFKNIVTDEVVEFDSITDFINKYNVDGSAASMLFNGKLKRAGDWYNPNNLWIPKKYIVISPENKEYTVIETKIMKFCNENDLEESNFEMMLKEKCLQNMGWRLKKNNEEYLKSLRNYKLISPEGKLIEVNNLEEIAKQNNLDPSCLHRVIRGKTSFHKGWTAYKEGGEPKPFDMEKHKFRYNLPKYYDFISPDGKLTRVENMSSFARNLGLKREGFKSLYYGKLKTYKGWTKYVEENSCQP